MYNKVKISQTFKVVNWKAVNYIMDLLTEYEDAGGDYKITLGCNGYVIWGYYSEKGDDQQDINTYKHLEISVSEPYIIEYSLTMYSRFYRGGVELYRPEVFSEILFHLSKSNRVVVIRRSDVDLDFNLYKLE